MSEIKIICKKFQKNIINKVDELNNQAFESAKACLSNYSNSEELINNCPELFNLQMYASMTDDWQEEELQCFALDSDINEDTLEVYLTSFAEAVQLIAQHYYNHVIDLEQLLADAERIDYQILTRYITAIYVICNKFNYLAEKICNSTSEILAEC